jgi:amidophosphoribosyltransferase
MEGLDKELNVETGANPGHGQGSNHARKKSRNTGRMGPEMEKLVHKDEKQRTFIADTKSRATWFPMCTMSPTACGKRKDTLVLLDDSIVRGTTLRDSIIQITARLRPKKIIVSSAARHKSVFPIATAST